MSGLIAMQPKGMEGDPLPPATFPVEVFTAPCECPGPALRPFLAGWHCPLHGTFGELKERDDGE